MKVKINEEETITLKDVNDGHVIIVLFRDKWTIVRHVDHNSTIYALQYLHNLSSKMNCMTIAKMLEGFKSIKEITENKEFKEMHVFYTFKQACEFLITVL